MKMKRTLISGIVGAMLAFSSFGASSQSSSYPYNGVYSWLPSAARTATQTLADQTGIDARGITVYCNVTVAPGVQTLTISVQEKDPLSGVYATVAANTATTATGLITVRVSQNITAIAASATGHTVNAQLPYTWRIVSTHSGAGSWTYSCNYVLMR